MKHILKKETKGKKFLYTVLDGDGIIISQRTSAREYVACTIYGDFYFGRLDLVGKGDHGRALKHHSNGMNDKNELENYREYCKMRYEALNSIAYL